MKVYAKVMVGPSIVKNPIEHDLGIVIVHDGKQYTLSESNQGELVLRSDTPLIINPEASNTIKIGSK